MLSKAKKSGGYKMVISERDIKEIERYEQISKKLKQLSKLYEYL